VPVGEAKYVDSLKFFTPTALHLRILRTHPAPLDPTDFLPLLGPTHSPVNNLLENNDPSINVFLCKFDNPHIHATRMHGLRPVCGNHTCLN
jgi:hypothetical protein